MIRAGAFALLTALAGCATAVTDTVFRTIIVDDAPYALRTRTISAPTGSFQTTSARVKNGYFPCVLDSPGDCAAAVRYGRDLLPDAGD